MRPPNLFSSIFAMLFLFPHGQGISEEYGEKDFVYVNCADQSFSPPLVNCKKLWIEQNLGHALIHDVIENQGKAPENGKYFFATNIKGIPIAIPRKNYDSNSKWLYGEELYLKIRTNIRSFVTKHDVDVIAVVGNATKISELETIKDLNNIDAVDNLLLMIWYSKSAGIEAIGFPTKYSSGDVYYCISQSCLFSQ